MQESELFDYDPMSGTGFTDGAHMVYATQQAYLLNRVANVDKLEAEKEMAGELNMSNLDEYVSDKYKKQMRLTAHQELGGRRGRQGQGMSACGQSVGSGSIGRYVFNPASLAPSGTRSKR